MRHPLAVLLLGALLTGGVGLAGCTEPPDDDHQPVALLQESHRVGEELYQWGDANYSGPQNEAKQVLAGFQVPADLGHVGVTFRGTYAAFDVREASFRIEDPQNRTVVDLDASPGEEDDYGTITDFWQFRRTVPVSPGNHSILGEGRGVALFEFRVHGIPREGAPLNETFNVTDTDRPVQLQVFVEGWGGAPRVSLIAPDGSRERLDISEPHAQTKMSFQPARGTYRLDVDTSGWGGRFVVQATQ